MQIEFIHSQGYPRLLLIFAGWGTDARPFKGVEARGYDVAVAYDYREINTGASERLRGYREICLVAWSFGVPAAVSFMQTFPWLPLTATVAVNGTLHPVDDRRGIPRAVFDGTLAGLSEATLRKFDRRMCGSAAALAEYDRVHPQRDFAGLADELKAIDSLPPVDGMAAEFDTVFVSDADRIIPTENQVGAWSGHPDVRMVKGPHLPDFNEIVRSVLTDKSLVASRFVASAASYDDEATAQRRIASRLADIVKGLLQGREIGRMVEVGAGTGLFTNMLFDSVIPADLELWDLAAMPESLPGRHRICDAETAIRDVTDGSLDMVVSASAVQWFNSSRAFIRECLRALAPGGMIAFSTFGPDNFYELNGYLPATPHYLSADSWRDMLEWQGWTNIGISEEKIVAEFDSPRSLVEHLRRTGVNALASPEKGVAPLRRIMADGITSLTYAPLFVVASRPE